VKIGDFQQTVLYVLIMVQDRWTIVSIKSE